MTTAVERWNALLSARARQMDAAYARLGRTSADFWERRARGYYRSTKDTTARDPLFLKVRDVVTQQTTVLDVGAGTGRFTLALAPLVKLITAVEPNSSMLNYLRHDASERGLTNISYVQTTWQDAPENLSAEIVLCSHVLYPIVDIVPFLDKLSAATRIACYIYMRATHIDSVTAHLWRHFHGDERCLPPGYINAVDVLYEMGIYANLEIVKVPPVQHYPSYDVAVEELLEQLILPDNPSTREELRNLLQNWLIEQDGVLKPPVNEMVFAIIWWRK